MWDTILFYVFHLLHLLSFFLCPNLQMGRVCIPVLFLPPLLIWNEYILFLFIYHLSVHYNMHA